VRRWLLGIAFFLAVLTAGVVLRATDYGAATTTTTSDSTTSTVSVSPAPSVTTSTPSSVTTTTERPLPPVLEPGVDDELVLVQPDAPRVAGIDYEAFPTGGDPSDPGGATYHVKADGTDDGDGSQEQPFATIERALTVAGEGDRVLVHAGSYSSRGLNVTQSRFALSDAGDGEVTIEADAPGSDYALSVSTPGQHDVLVRGLRFVGFDGVGIRCGNPVTVARVTLERVTVEGAEEGLTGYFDLRGTIVDGLLLRQVSLLAVGRAGVHLGAGGIVNFRAVGLHVVVVGGEASSATTAGAADEVLAGIAVENGDNVVIENSIVEGARGDGMRLDSARSAAVSVIVRHVAGRGLVLGSGGDVINALVFDTGGDAQIVTGAGSYRIVNCTLAYHNLGAENAYAAAFGFGTTSDPVDVTVLNCLFYEQPGPVYLPGRADMRMENNIFWGFPDTLVSWGVRQWGPDYVETIGLGNLADDPLLVDPERGDFHPGVGSPLFAAAGAFPETPAVDLLGVPRVEIVTVGAFQTTRAPIPHSPTTTSTTVQ
jgi:hypothetical protein